MGYSFCSKKKINNNNYDRLFSYQKLECNIMRCNQVFCILEKSDIDVLMIIRENKNLEHEL